MALSKTQQRILYSLGHCYQKLNEPYENSPLKVRISKIEFIDLIKQADFVQKQERALYKNLELLEKKKLIEYVEKKIRLTQKGQRFFNKIEKEVKPWISIKDFWNRNLRSDRRLQTFMK
tara:strand:- start:608 stop:964 length:357 start_codon:yes stop_codon:yes gene_type:complete